MHYQLKWSLANEHNQSFNDSDSVSCHIAIKIHPGVLLSNSRVLQHHLRASLNACIETVVDAIGLHHAMNTQSFMESDTSKASRLRGTVRDGAAPTPNGRLGNVKNPLPNSFGATDQDGMNRVNLMSGDTSPVESATRGQRRAINAVCHRLSIAPDVAADNHHFELRSLTKRQASLLINQLRNLERNPRQAQCYFGDRRNQMDADCHAATAHGACCLRCVARSA